MNGTPQYKSGQIHLMKFTGEQNEQQGWRPGLIIQNNKGNLHSPNVIALPLTSSLKKLNQPTHVFVKASENGLKADSVVLCENPQRVSKENIKFLITDLPDEKMAEIAKAYFIASPLISYLDINEMNNLWYDCSNLHTA